MADTSYLSSVLPDGYLSPYRRQIVLGIIAMTIARVIHPAAGIALFLSFTLLSVTNLHKYVRKGSTGILLLFTALYILHSSVLLLVLFTFYFQMLYFWSAKKHTHFFWITAVGFVHLAIVSTITGSVIFPFLFIAYVIVLTQSLLVANFLSGLQDEDGVFSRRELDRTGTHFLRKMKAIGNWIGGTSIVIAVLFFPFLPRFTRLSYQPTQFSRASVTGFADEVALGEIGEIQSDNRVALRVFAPARLASRIYRWRGATLDNWDHSKQRWTATPLGTALQPGRGKWISFYPEGTQTRDETIRVNVSSMSSPMIFLPELADRPPRAAAKVRGVFQSLRFDYSSWTCAAGRDFSYRNYEYEIAMLPVAEPWIEENPSEETLRRCTNLNLIPEDFIERLVRESDRLLRLSGSAPSLSDPLQIARKLSSGVQMSNSYTLDYRDEGSARDLEDFIFNKKAGHCEFFATTLALLLRVNRIPARIVTGFRPGRTNFFNNYQIIRQSDAHSWVEAYIPGEGWLGFDPTPSAPQTVSPLAQNLAFLLDIYDYLQLQWNRHVLDYSNDDQRGLLATMSHYLGIVATPILIGTWTLILMRKVIAGILFVLFFIWLIREIAPELDPLFHLWTSGIPGLRRFGFQRKEYHPVTRLFRRVEKNWSRKGFERKAGETPKQYLARIGDQVEDSGDLCSRFVSLYYTIRFGPQDSNGAELKELQNLTLTLTQLKPKAQE